PRENEARPEKRAILIAKRLEARGQPRHLSRSSSPVDNSFGHAAHDLGLRRLERRGCRFLVAGGQRFLDVAHRAPHLASPVLVDGGALGGLAYALFGGSMCRHGCSFVLSRGLAPIARGPYCGQ